MGAEMALGVRGEGLKAGVSEEGTKKGADLALVGREEGPTLGGGVKMIADLVLGGKDEGVYLGGRGDWEELKDEGMKTGIDLGLVGREEGLTLRGRKEVVKMGADLVLGGEREEGVKMGAEMALAGREKGLSLEGGEEGMKTGASAVRVEEVVTTGEERGTVSLLGDRVLPDSHGAAFFSVPPSTLAPSTHTLPNPNPDPETGSVGRQGPEDSSAHSHEDGGRGD